MAMKVAVFFPETGEFTVLNRRDLKEKDVKIGTKVCIVYEKPYEARVIGVDRSQKNLDEIIERENQKLKGEVAEPESVTEKNRVENGPTGKEGRKTGAPPSRSFAAAVVKTSSVKTPAKKAEKTPTATPIVSRSQRAAARSKEDTEEDEKEDGPPETKRPKFEGGESQLQLLYKKKKRVEQELDLHMKNVTKATAKLKEVKEAIRELEQKQQPAAEEKGKVTEEVVLEEKVLEEVVTTSQSAVSEEKAADTRKGNNKCDDEEAEKKEQEVVTLDDDDEVIQNLEEDDDLVIVSHGDEQVVEAQKGSGPTAIEA